MRRVLYGSLCLALIVPATRALACGHCIEDKIAAVYDYALVTQATARNHEVVFFALAGRLVSMGAHVAAMTPGELAEWVAQKVR